MKTRLNVTRTNAYRLGAGFVKERGALPTSLAKGIEKTFHFILFFSLIFLSIFMQEHLV